MSNRIDKINNELQNSKDLLIRAERLASIGQLAAGMAHEINNPLGYIDSNLSTLKKYTENLSLLLHFFQKYKSAAEQKNRVEVEKLGLTIAELQANMDIPFLLQDIENLIKESREGVTHIKKIILNLKTFAHDDQEKSLINIHEILEGVLSIVWSTAKYKVEFHKQYGEAPPVECRPQQLGHAFINILLNAVQAMPHGGDITITTGVKIMKEREPGVGRRKDDVFRVGESVLFVNIKDSGEGIPKENLEKIFGPFFTTREADKKAGLGLSISLEIVRKHRGIILVESEVGKGSEFKVFLPTILNA